MSRFFRRGSNDSSSTDSTDSTNEETEEVSQNAQELSSSVDQVVDERLKALSVSRQASTASHRDVLLHALLEERCMREVLDEQQWARRGSSEVKVEARARYRRLCAQLVPLSLVSADLDHDRHFDTRQTYRDGLNILSGKNQLVPKQHATTPRDFRKLLTDSTRPSVFAETLASQPLAGPLSLLNPTHQISLPVSQYLRDFEEIGVLGRGGYGTVYHVRHRLDSHTYAVKKVRLRSNIISHVDKTGIQPELEETLVELRTLAKLEHPNVVRYYSSWVEWMAPETRSHATTDDDLFSGTPSAWPRNDDDGQSESASLHRVITAGTDSASNQGLVITFGEPSWSSQQASESRGSAASNSQQRVHFATSEDGDEFSNAVALGPSGESAVPTGAAASSPDQHSASADNALTNFAQPCLALHIQMAMYPMTLADFLSPRPSPRPDAGSDIAPLAHCFHLETSIRVMLALLDGIEYIHSRGIVHRDLKPANIFLRLEKNPRAREGCVDLLLCSHCRANNAAQPALISVCIGDFGLVGQIAAAEGIEAHPPHSSSSAATASSQPAASPVGTELYRPVTPPTSLGPSLDIFSLGVIAFELLYKFTTQMERRETLQNLRRGQFPAQFPLQAKELISSMLCHDVAAQVTVTELKSRLSAMLVS